LIDPTFNTHDGHDARVTDAQARKTALLVACVLLALAAWFFYRGRTTTAIIFTGVALALLVMGFFVSPLARRFHTYWMKLAALLGYVNSRILLSLLFYMVFTPYGVVMRLAGRDPLRRRGAKRESYWTTRKRTRQPREQFERLF
jgi:hypothetical protein